MGIFRQPLVPPSLSPALGLDGRRNCHHGRRYDDCEKCLPCCHGKSARQCLACNPKHNFTTYQKGATKRGLSFGISFDEFLYLLSQSCHYCGTPSDNGKMGIDRKDNTKGYVLENSLPCCYLCNRAKGDKPYEEFILWVVRLAQYRVKLAWSEKLNA